MNDNWWRTPASNVGPSPGWTPSSSRGNAKISHRGRRRRSRSRARRGRSPGRVGLGRVQQRMGSDDRHAASLAHSGGGLLVELLAPAEPGGDVDDAARARAGWACARPGTGPARLRMTTPSSEPSATRGTGGRRPRTPGTSGTRRPPRSSARPSAAMSAARDRRRRAGTRTRSRRLGRRRPGSPSTRRARRASPSPRRAGAPRAR